MCFWCGLWIIDAEGATNAKEKFCGPVCRTHFQLRADPQKMRQHIFFRDNGRCARCGFEHKYLDGDWEADHVVPLMVAFADPAAWEPENLVVLCTAPNKCHYEKSAEDLRKYRKQFRVKAMRIFDEIS